MSAMKIWSATRGDRCGRSTSDLELGDFEPAAGAVEAYFSQRADYRPSRYQLTPEQHAAVTQRRLPHMRRYGYAAERALRE